MTNEPDDMTTDQETSYRPKKTPHEPTFRTFITSVCWGLVIGFTIGFVIGILITPLRAQEVCRPKQPDCVPPPIQSQEGCGKWFKPFTVSERYYEACIAKLPRLVETHATDEAKQYFFCRCEYQGSVWSRRDP